MTRWLAMWGICWVGCLAPLVAWGDEGTAAKRVAAIAPFLDDGVVAVARVDLAQVKLAEARRLFEENLALLVPGSGAELTRTEGRLTRWIDELRAAGAEEVYLITSLVDLPQPPFAVVTLRAGSDAKKLARLLAAGPEGWEEATEPGEHAVLHDKLVMGIPATLERLKTVKSSPHADLAAAFDAAGEGAVQVAVVVPDDARRVLSETLPTLPEPFDAYSGKDLATVRYAALGLQFPPQLAVRVTIQTRDDAAAARLAALAHDGLKMLAPLPQVKEFFPRFDELAKHLAPERRGDRLTLTLDEENRGIETVLAILTPPVQAARAAAQRAQAMNNLKQFGLAMHNYHDAYRSFPPAATVKDGKPLLSWRVRLLPYLAEQKLYDEFRHDEPWDSEHNLKLLERMPKVFAPPGVDGLKPGTTTYLLPTGEGMVFHGARATKISEIHDGTSNTIMIVEAQADRAVPWTKPDDLAIDLDNPLAGLKEARGAGFLAAFCDGSVRFIANTVDPKTLALLFQMADGQPVDFR